MPPKPKFTREEIIAAALEIVSEKGIEALTAKELGEKLGSSARPRLYGIQRNAGAAGRGAGNGNLPADAGGCKPAAGHALLQALLHAAGEFRIA